MSSPASCTTRASDRGDLLVKLLDLGLYDRMAQAARQRRSAASTAAEIAETLLAKLAHATPEGLADAAARVDSLEALRTAVDQAEPELERLRRTEADTLADVERAQATATRLEAVSLPRGLHTLQASLAEATDAARSADTSEEAAAAVLDAAEDLVAAQPRAADLHAIIDAHRAASTHREQQAKGQVVLVERRTAEAAAQAAVDDAQAGLAAATAALEAAQWDHRAHDLATRLVSGEPCPVCRQPVTVLPASGPSGQDDPVGQARAARTRAEDAHQAAAAALRTAERERVEVESKLAGIESQLLALQATLDDHPEPAAVQARIDEVDAALAAERQARADATAARKSAIAARKALAELQDHERTARRRFEQTRGELVPLGPPPSTDHLVADWEALVAWATQQAEQHRDGTRQQAAQAQRFAAERTELEQALAERCRSAGVAVVAGSDRGPRQAVADALGEAAAAVTEIERSMAEAEQHRGEARAQQTTAQVAGELAKHLSANHFEQWVLDEVLGSLVARATELLVDLSGGAYSLALDERSNFAVVDHRNADQVRSARTLSGGETFLASLALALALADQIGELATRGSARLESIFLDEGFGTLDPDTLDTVATAIDELGARGRMVGLVSHVPELAERVPTRFEVRRDPAGSTVVRIDR